MRKVLIKTYEKENSKPRKEIFIMAKKFELLDETMMCNGFLLYRIRATRSFGVVTKGEKGGYVSSEECLSHYGTCWVGKNAKVIHSKITGNALVTGSATVFDDSRIRGHAYIGDNSRVIHSIVTDNSAVSGKAVVRDSNIRENASVYGDAKVIKSSCMKYAHIAGDANVTNSTLSGDVRLFDGCVRNTVMV